jgi:hypothetical protein
LRRELVEACDPEFAPSLRVEESVAGDSVRLFEPDELDQVPVGFID